MRSSRTLRRAVVLALVLCGLVAGMVPAQAAPPVPPDVFAVRGYIDSVYLDLFGRAPDPAGEADWEKKLLDHRTPRVAVANAITGSEEYRSRLIAGLYEEFLGRGPDAAGLRNWLDMMARGWTVARIGSGFIASDEYYRNAGGTPVGWVQRLYGDVLHRGASPGEVASWVGQLARGVDRSSVAMGFLLSTEHLSTVINGYYEDLLGRGLDPAGQATWVRSLQAGGRDEDIIGGILASEEYWGLAAASAARREVGIAFYPIDHVRIGERIVAGVYSFDQYGDFVRIVTPEATLSLVPYPGYPVSPCPQDCLAPGPVGTSTIYASWNGFSASTTYVADPSAITVVGPLVAHVAGPVPSGTQVTFQVNAVDSLQRPADPGPGVLSTSDPASSCQGLTCTLSTPGPVTVLWTSTVSSYLRASVDLVVLPA